MGLGLSPPPERSQSPAMPSSEAAGMVRDPAPWLGHAVTLSVVAAASAHLLGRLGYHASLYGSAVSDVFTLFGFLALGAPAFFILRQVYDLPRITRMVLAGTALMVFGQALRVSESTVSLAAFYLAYGHPLILIKEAAFVVGIGSFAVGFYRCIFETDRAKVGLQRERQDLIREVEERKRAEQALQDAYAEVERRVEVRTANLAEANRRLEEEIAERARAEKALRDSERRYRSLAEAAQDVIFIIGPDDTVLYVNSFAATQLGRRPEDIIGKPRAALFPAEVSSIQQQRLRTVLETGMPVRVENEARFSDHAGWQDTHLVPLKDEHGRVSAVLGVSRDITERKHMEEALRASEERYRGLIEHANDVVWRVDTRGIFTFVSPVVRRLAGYDPEELLGKSFEVVLTDESARAAFESLSRRVQGALTEDRVALELTHRRKDGTCFLGEVFTTPILDPDGRLIEIQGITRDITEQKNSERLVEEHRAKLIESSRMSVLGEMAANIAHEINNPLAVVSGSAEQLRAALNMEPPPRDMLFKLTDSVTRNALRIRQIVKGLRNYTRESSQDPFEPASLKTIVEDTVVLCRQSFASHHVTLTVGDVPEHLMIECHSTQIMEVLVNLFSNAVHAVEHSSGKWVSLAVADQGDAVEIAVTDGGPGVPSHMVSTLFDPFVTTKAPGKGTGLGLSIAKRIVQGHDGTITLDTTSANTRFVVRLPKKQRMS